MATIAEGELPVAVRVWGPHWVGATEVRLYSNGQLIRTAKIPKTATGNPPRALKWQGEWQLKFPKQDVHLVAIATGPGIQQVYWKTAKPYQPQSPNWEPRVIGCSGAVWIDADGDGRRTSAYEYAQGAFAESGGDLAKLIAVLSRYDQAVASQAAHLYQSSGQSLLSLEATEKNGPCQR